VRVVAGERVGHARYPGVKIAAPEVLGADRLSCRRLHQRRTAEEDRALLLDDDGFVRHRRHIGAAGGARAHHDGDLGDPRRRHAGLVEEDPAEVLAVREHVRLMRQVRPPRIHQVNAGEMVFRRHLLRPKVLLDGHRVIGAALDGRVVGDDHRLAAVDEADARQQAGAVNVALVHAERRERADLEKRRSGIDQPRHAFAGEQLSPSDVAFARFRRPALGGGAPPRLQIIDQASPAGDVGLVFVGRGTERALQPCHGARFPGSSFMCPAPTRRLQRHLETY